MTRQGDGIIGIDLFAGAGGLSLGAEMAGLRVIFANDVDPWAAATYRFNNPHTVFDEGPIEDLRADSVLPSFGLEPGDLDVLLGGPPCQGFSIYAPKRDPKDRRNALILEYLRIVRETMPKYLVMENVPGLLSLGRGVALRTVYQQLEELGYHVQHRVLLAARYGVPQDRWRLFIIGSRRDMVPAEFPEPTHHATAVANFTGGAAWVVSDTDHLPPAVTVREAIGDLPRLNNGGGEDEMPMPKPERSALSDFQRWARGDTEVLYNHVAPRLGAKNMERLSYIKPGGNWTDIPHHLLPPGMQRARKSDHTKRYGRLDPDGQSGTILTKADPHWGSFFHYEQDRVITPREAARLQSFPDHYRFLGSQSAQYTQIGNAVPPLMAKAVVSEILAALEKSRTEKMASVV